MSITFCRNMCNGFFHNGYNSLVRGVHMTEQKRKERFTYLGCCDDEHCTKDCMFYWHETDYWGECDEGCYWGQFNPKYQPRTKLVCYLPRFIQKLIMWFRVRFYKDG